jgi:putative oxidoreductase
MLRIFAYLLTFNASKLKKLLSIKYSPHAFNTAMLLLRVCIGILMMSHGFGKLQGYGKNHSDFMNFLGMGSTVSYTLVVFAEFFCALFVVIGLFTRVSCIPLIITMGVALFKAHNGELFGDGETSAIYLVCFVVILLLGPGKFSIDGMAGK